MIAVGFASDLVEFVMNILCGASLTSLLRSWTARWTGQPPERARNAR
jgi:hypothetical protein